MARLRHLLLTVIVPLRVLPESSRTRLMRWCGIALGEGTVVRGGTRFTPGQITIGGSSWVNFNCVFDASAPIRIGDSVDIGFDVKLVTADHEIADGSRRAGKRRDGPITIESGCWLGASVTVLPGVTIGRGSVVAAGAVVTHDCPPHGLYAGIPARRVRDLPESSPRK